MSQWPLDEDGKPMALVTMGVSEKIGMPHYSNVDLGPASVSRFCKDTEEEIKETLAQAIGMCEEVIAVERQAVLDVVKRSIDEAHGS